MKHTALILFLSLLVITPPLNAQSIGDRQTQVGVTVVGATTPDTPSSYTWQEISNTLQGVDVNVVPTEIQTLYLQQNNSRINFNTYDTGHIMVRLEVKYDSGSWNVLFSDESRIDSGWQTPPFSSLGYHTVEVKWFDFSGSIYNRVYDVYVVPEADKLYEDNYGNTMTLWGTGSTQDPLLVSEGFDGYNRSYPERFREAGKELFDELVQNGFKVYVLNYAYNVQDMRNSAAIFNAATHYVSSINAGKSVIAVGISMGGVIARYALAKAEGDGDPLPANKFISVDSPQQGANISLAFQSIIEDPPTGCTEGNDYQKFALSSTAARQLLYESAWTSLHDSFYNELESLNSGLGYPTLARNVGVAFSNNSPNPDSGVWINVRVKGTFGIGLCDFDEDVTLTATDRLAGSYLPLDLTDQDPQHLWWGWVSITQYKDATFIPYVSALDLNGSQSPFDDAIESATARYHDQLPSDVVQELLEELGVEPTPLTASINGPSWLGLGEEGTWYASASGGAAPYSYQWDYKLLCSSLGPQGGGGPQPMEVTCDEWHSGGSDYSFSRSVSGDATMQIRLIVTDDDSDTETVYKTVTIGDGGGLFYSAKQQRQGISPSGQLLPAQEALMPQTYSLEQNYPNPFNRSTEIPFALPEAGTATLVVYDLMGREVTRLLERNLSAGSHRIMWDARGMPSGVYFYQLRSGTFSQTRRMTLMK